MDWKAYPIATFSQFQAEWDQLNHANGSSPLLDSRFVEPLLDNFSTGKEILVICTHAGETQCMTIISKDGLGMWHTFQPSQAPIGCWVQRSGTDIEQLTRSLASSLPGPVLLVGITQQDPNLLPRPKHTRNFITLDYIETARVAITETFEEYWARRGKNLRQNLRRQRNRLARENVEIKLVAIRETSAMRNAVKEYGILESAGWKSGGGTAIHIDNSQGRFYTKLLQNFSNTEQAIVYQYFYGAALVATDLCIIGGGKLIILKTTYDESITTSSPAMLMREDAFNEIFTNRLAEYIEFYGKVMDWHKRWSDDFRTMYHINSYSRLGALVNRARKMRK